MFGTEIRVLKFDGIEESLLLIPMDAKRAGSQDAEQALAGSHAWALVSVENDSEVEQAARDFEPLACGIDAERSGQTRD